MYDPTCPLTLLDPVFQSTIETQKTMVELYEATYMHDPVTHGIHKKCAAPLQQSTMGICLPLPPHAAPVAGGRLKECVYFLCAASR
jgi:hypothetical protein